MDQLFFPAVDEFKYMINRKVNAWFHTHHKYEVYYFHSGKCKYVLGGQTIELEPGDFIIMNGMREHGPVMDKDYTYVRSTILFDSVHVQPLQQQPGSVDLLEPFEVLQNYHWRLSGDLKQEIEDILFRMHRAHGGTDQLSHHKLRTAFTELLLFLYERYQNTVNVQQTYHSEKEKHVRNVIAYIERNYMNEIELDKIAAELHLSRFYLMKIFREIAGMTIFDYINQRRINQAKVLFFLDKKRSVTDVCYSVGFKHLPHFSRNFKKIVGLTPEQYRRFI